MLTATATFHLRHAAYLWVVNGPLTALHLPSPSGTHAKSLEIDEQILGGRYSGRLDDTES